MNGLAVIYAIRWLIYDTFRQALANRIFWIMLAVSGLCIAFCLSVGIEGGASLRPEGENELYTREGQPLAGPNPNPGYLKLLFGAVRVELPRSRSRPGSYGEAGVHLVSVILGQWVAGAGGLLLALLWTAGFLPEFLQPGAALVVLAKPVPRWALLFGKYLGVVAFVALQAIVFFGGTWLAFGLSTGVWLEGYLLSAPLLVLHFAVIYSFSVLMAVCTCSTIASLFGSMLFWFLCFAMNYARHAVVALPHLAPNVPPYPPLFQALVEGAYWIMPKPADFVILLNNVLEAGEHFTSPPEFDMVQQLYAFDPALSLVTSLCFAVGLLIISSLQLAKTEY